MEVPFSSEQWIRFLTKLPIFFFPNPHWEPCKIMPSCSNEIIVLQLRNITTSKSIFLNVLVFCSSRLSVFENPMLSRSMRRGVLSFGVWVGEKSKHQVSDRRKVKTLQIKTILNCFQVKSNTTKKRKWYNITATHVYFPFLHVSTIPWLVKLPGAWYDQLK